MNSIPPAAIFILGALLVPCFKGKTEECFHSAFAAYRIFSEFHN